MRFAGRWSTPHPWLVRDEMPWMYLRDVPGLDETLTRLVPLLLDVPALWPLVMALPELRAAHRALLEMTTEEHECGLPGHPYGQVDN